MPPQLSVFVLYLAVALVVASVFAFVALSSRRPREVAPRSIDRARVAFFAVLSVALLSVLGMTLRHLPYDLGQGQAPDRLLFIAGKQFAFAVSDRPIATDEEWQARTMAEPVKLPAGALVELRVTTFDVNHDAGLYDPDGVLIGQIQAMPGYLNRLRMRFARPGRYDILCLELCGNGHGRMRGVFEVEGAPAVAASVEKEGSHV